MTVKMMTQKIILLNGDELLFGDTATNSEIEIEDSGNYYHDIGFNTFVAFAFGILCGLVAIKRWF